MTESGGGGGRPRQFTDDDILRATVALVEAEGVGRLTMRRLGAALGVEAMAIYRYFPSRQDLVDALVDWVVLQTAADPELQFDHADDWRDYLDRLAHGIRQMALTHPRVFPLIATTPTAAPWIRPPMRSLEWVNAFLVGLQDHHFPPAAAVTVYKQFSSFLLGHLLLEVAALDLERDGGRRDDPDRRVAQRHRREDAEQAADVMRDGDGPTAREILAGPPAGGDTLADEPAVQSADPDVALHAAGAHRRDADADVPIVSTRSRPDRLDLSGYPQVDSLADLLAEDSAPADFERQLDRLLDDIESLRRP